jgi:PAS domain S-box-containing protein
MGGTTQQLQGRSVLDLVTPEDRDGLSEMIRSVIAGESQGLGGPEWHYLRRDGGLVVGRSHASVVRNGSGEAEMVVLQFEDRTERRRISQELARVRDDLAHVGRLGTVGELATGIAHEINQPLTAISTYATACRFMLERGDAPTERLIETLNKISESARRAGAVIEHLRGFLRKRGSERVTLRAEELVRSVAELVGVNLLLNALDAMETLPGGRILVSVSQPCESEVLVSVCDEGMGIPENLGERVFESFFSTKPTGMGFGLALSRSIVEAHGGRLWFTANQDGGTTFHLALPPAVVADDDSEARSIDPRPPHQEAVP